MNKYEILYILDNSLTDENKSKIVDKFTGVVEQMKGTTVELDKWGTKKLAYDIDKKSDGYYFLMNIEADPTVPAEIERQVKITDGVIRCMVIKKDEFNKKKAKPVKSETKTEKSEEDLNYGAPIKEGLNPEFGVVNNDDITAEKITE